MIGFFGDSWAADDNKNAWTTVLAEKLDMKYRIYAMSGSSIWYTYNQIIMNSKKIIDNEFKFLFVTLTSSKRIPFTFNPKMSWVKGIDNLPKHVSNIDPVIGSKHKIYYEDFFDEKLHSFIAENVINDIVNLYAKSTNLILLDVLGEYTSLLESKYLSKQNFSYTTVPLIKLHTEKQSPDDNLVINHMSKEDNYLLANRFYSMILDHQLHKPIDFNFRGKKR
jgi:hypothetical protein